MNLYSAHLKPNAEPVLVREGFSPGALLFGPLWLAAHRAWLAALITVALAILIAVLAPLPLGVILGLGLAVLLGLNGYDLQRWSMERRGYQLVHIVAGRGAEDALLRLLSHRPDLSGRYTQGALR